MEGELGATATTTRAGATESKAGKVFCSFPLSVSTTVRLQTNATVARVRSDGRSRGDRGLEKRAEEEGVLRTETKHLSFFRSRGAFLLDQFEINALALPTLQVPLSSHSLFKAA